VSPVAATGEVVDGVAVETTRVGQVRLALPGIPRQPHPTGVQVPCARCAAAGVDKLGVPFRFRGDPTPLCMPCWRGEQQRRARRDRQELAELLWEGIGEAEAAAACQACGAPDPVPDCWLCGHSWLAAAQAEHERELAAQTTTVDAEFARIQARTEAEDRVAWLSGWIDRCQAMLTAYRAGGGRGRPVELLADLLARDAAARTSERGRPSALPRVAAILALDSDWRSGRRALPGRARTATLAGCCERAVTSAWRRATAVLGWAVRTRQGRRLTLEERTTLGRWNDRAEYDLQPLHRGDRVTRARYLPAALAVFGELLEHAADLLRQAQDDLDELRARTGRVTDWPEQARRARLRLAAARAKSITTPLEAAALTANICSPHTVSKGECVSSCSYWGLRFSPPNMIHSVKCQARPHSGRGNYGASRSPTRGGQGDLDSSGLTVGKHRRSSSLQHPRTHYAQCGAPPSRPRKAPSWAVWAYPLARELRTRWVWLAGVNLTWVAATLGAALGPDWTAEQLVTYVRDRRGRALLDSPAAPVAYLKAVLADLLGEAAYEPPAPARAVEARRARVEDQAAALRQRRAERDSEAEARDAAATPGHTNPDVAALRARLPRGRRRPELAARIDNAYQAEIEGWPEVRQPGSGLPPTGRDS